MTLHIIHDSRRVERYSPLIAELKRQNIEDFEIFPCLIYDNVVRSINASHKMIVRIAKEQGLPEVFIAEDDLCFPSDKGWEWFLKNKPPLYDIYISGSYDSFKRPSKQGAFRVDSIVGFQLYAVSSRYYDTFLSTPDDQHIDSAQKSNSMFVCFPFAAIQRPGFSANNKAFVDYNQTLLEGDIYK